MKKNYVLKARKDDFQQIEAAILSKHVPKHTLHFFQKSFQLKVRMIYKLKRHLRLRSGFVLFTIEISVNIK